MTTPTLAKFQALATALKGQFIDRDDIIDAMLAALASGNHVLLLGEPGTGKSALVNALNKSISGASMFSWLLTKASPPEELLGPLSLKALENDEFKRITTGKLPEAHIAFLDEIWKANSTILNALLGILNERVFYNGPTPTTVPLLAAFGASNEYPTDTELAALWDRFLVKFWIDRLSDADKLGRLLSMPEPRGVPGALTLADIEQARLEVRAIKFGQPSVDSVVQARRACDEAGYLASDRRWRQASRYLRAVAWLNGDTEVTSDHLFGLADCMWREHKERPKLLSTFGKLANPGLMQAIELLDAVKAMSAEALRRKTIDNKPEEETPWMHRIAKASKEARSASARLGELATLHPTNARIKKIGAEVTALDMGLRQKALALSGMSPQAGVK